MRTVWANLRDSPDRALSMARYRRLADGYDASCKYIGEARRAALEALELGPGQTVFDVACGTGAMLPGLAAGVGQQGWVLGMEQSPDMSRIARQRVAALGGEARIALLESGAEEACPPWKADAMLFCYTHDVLHSPAALENLFRNVRPGARVVALGIRFLPWWWAAPLNLWVCARSWPYHTTYKGFREPWQPLRRYCPDFRVLRSFHMGTSYLAAGCFSG